MAAEGVAQCGPEHAGTFPQKAVNVFHSVDIKWSMEEKVDSEAAAREEGDD